LWWIPDCDPARRISASTTGNGTRRRRRKRLLATCDSIVIVPLEYLQTTLGELRTAGVRSYVGMCYRHFFIKREHAFREAGTPTVLVDITVSNFYELQ
jgi:hypothetical protein